MTEQIKIILEIVRSGNLNELKFSVDELLFKEMVSVVKNHIEIIDMMINKNNLYELLNLS